MKYQRSTGLFLAVVACLTTSCQSDGGRSLAPSKSTPAPDATVGIAPGLADVYTQTLNWKACGDQFQCSTATVPVDYSHPDGKTIELSLLRVPASGDDRLGSLLVNPGGPGGSGVEYAQLAGSVATEQVREHYDIVGFDPRGVGRSEPIDCVDDDRLDDVLTADMSPDDAAEITQMQHRIDEFSAGCQSRSSDLLPHIGTANVARDLDVLRAALGDQKLNYLGKSYGTYIGAMYADLFPGRIGRVVLDGAIDPTLDGGELALGQAEGFERALTAFLDWCFGQDDCAVGSSQDKARRTIRDLFDRLDREPMATDDESRPLTESLAFYGLALPLYLTPDEGYPPLNQALDLALKEDDGTLLLTLADLYLERNSDGTYRNNQNEVLTVVNCVDHPETLTVDEVKASLPTFREASSIFGPLMAWGGLSCDHMVSETSQPTPSPSPAQASPVLVVGTTGDPATPYDWAQGLTRHLPAAMLLTYKASTHTAYLNGSDCIDHAVDAYFLAGTVPKDGTACTS